MQSELKITNKIISINEKIPIKQEIIIIIILSDFRIFVHNIFMSDMDNYPTEV